MNDLPVYVWAAVLIGVVGLPAATVVTLARGALAARLGGRSAAIIAVVAGAVWAGWLAGSFALTDAGVYRQDGDRANPLIAVTLLAVLAALLLAARVPTVERILADPGTPARLALPQTFRVVGGVFLIVLGLGELPAVFAVPAGVGDIAVGVAAPFVAWRLSHGTGRLSAVWFNVLGIVDLAVAVGIGFLAGFGPTNLLPVTPSTEAVTMLPLALIPVTAVPLAVALHVISLRRLRTTLAGRPRPSWSQRGATPRSGRGMASLVVGVGFGGWVTDTLTGRGAAGRDGSYPAAGRHPGRTGLRRRARDDGEQRTDADR